MDNWQLYELANIAANKDVQSNWLTPAQFELELIKCNILLMRDRLGLPERYQPGEFASGSGASRVIDSDLSVFQKMSTVPVTSQETNVTDWYYINGFYTADSVYPEIISTQELPSRLKHPTKTPNIKYPIGLVIEKGLKIWPSSITSITLIYYRKPIAPVFATTVNTTTGELEYNATGSKELEWRDENKIAILHLILQDLGVNIEKQSLEQLAQKYVEGGK